MNDCRAEVVARYLEPEGAPRVAAALNYARNHRVGTLPVQTYIQAALRTGDALTATTAHRFCSTFVKGFEEIGAGGGGAAAEGMEFVGGDAGYSSAVERLRRVSMS